MHVEHSCIAKVLIVFICICIENCQLKFSYPVIQATDLQLHGFHCSDEIVRDTLLFTHQLEQIFGRQIRIGITLMG